MKKGILLLGVGLILIIGIFSASAALSADAQGEDLSGSNPGFWSFFWTQKEEDVSSSDKEKDDKNEDKKTDVSQNDPDVLPDEECLYVIKAPSTGIGRTKIVAHSAFVMLDENQVNVRQGEYVPEMEEQLQKRLDAREEIEGNTIKAFGLYKEKELTAYAFPKDVEITSIGKFAFARTSLSRIVIPEGVTSIGDGAFYHCDQLREVVIPSTVTSVGEHAFDFTPFMNSFLEDETATDLIVGDGVVLAHKEIIEDNSEETSENED